MRGGVLSRVDARTLDEQFKYILSNSTLELKYHGEFGFAGKVTMKEGFVSGFLDEDETPTNTFIIKLVPLDMLMAHHSDRKWSRSSDIRYFYREIQFQQKVYEESLIKHHYSPCPALLHHSLYTVEEVDRLFPGEFLYAYDDVPTRDQDLRIGILFMEFACSAQGLTLLDAVESGVTTIEERKGEATRLYCMALECGVNHRDAHRENFLIDNKGRLKLIDFGVAQELTKKQHDRFNALIKDVADEETVRALQDELKKIFREDKFFKKYPWFLSDPFTIGPYPDQLPADLVERCKHGICIIEINDQEEQGRKREMNERKTLELERIEMVKREREELGRKAIEDSEIDKILDREYPPPKDPREATRFRIEREKNGQRETIRMELREKKRIQEEQKERVKQEALSEQKRLEQQKEQQASEKARRTAEWQRKKQEDLAIEEARIEAWMHQKPETAHEKTMLKKVADKKAEQSQKDQQETDIKEIKEARERQLADRRAKQEQDRRAAGETRRAQAEALNKERMDILKYRNAPTIPKEDLNDASLEQLKAEIIHVAGVLPDLSELNRLFNNEIYFSKDDENYEKNMYVFYLTKIQSGLKRRPSGGTHKRRKRRTLKK